MSRSIPSENKFLSVFENSLNGIILGTPDGHILEANHAALEMFGYSLEELKIFGRSVIFDITDPNMIAGLKKRALTGKDKGELIGIRKSGERFSCEYSSAIFKNENDEERTSTVLSDITQRKKAEEAARLLLDNTEESFMLVDRDLRIVSFNKHFNSQYKKFLNKDVKKGDLILDYAKPERVNTIKNNCERVLNGEIVEDEISIKNDFGTFIFLNRYKPALDNDGKLIGVFISMRDLTENRRAQELLVENEKLLKENLEQLKMLTDNVDAVIYQFQITPDGKMSFPFMSKSINKLRPDLNIEALKEDAAPAFATVHPDDLTNLMLSIEDSKNNLTKWDYEYRSITENDKIVWIKASSHPYKKNNGSIVWYGYILDITERKINEEQLRLSNERFDIIAKATNDTIWDIDLLTGNIIWNKGIHGIYGYKNNEPGINTKHWWHSKIHPDDLEQVNNALAIRIKNKVLRWEHEYRFLCADNTYKNVFDRGFLVVNAHGDPVRMIGAMQDITIQKQEEHRLKLMESVITNTNDSVVITEAEPFNEPGPKIVYVNEAFTRMTGYTAEEAIGKSPRILQGPKTSKEELKKLHDAMKKWQSCEITIINYKKNGDEFWTNFTITPVADEKGWYTHWIAIERDVTRFKLDELEREQIISELSQNNKDLKQFSYVTSHNLRAPIANLLGLTSLIDQYKIQDIELIQLLDGIRQSALMFDDTVKDLTQVLLIKDQSNIVKEQISLEIVINKVMKQLNIANDSAELIVNYNFNDCLFINFTNAYLESILLNLFTNAMKYKSAKRALKIDVTSKDEIDFVELRFSDNGIGIDTKKYKDKLFKLYQRFHDQSDGKGLGLYLIKSQLEALAGTIEIESEIDRGTTFIIQIKK